MPQITKTREVAPGCYVVVRFTCPKELRDWAGPFSTFLRQADALYFDETATPENHFPDGDLCYNEVSKLIDGYVCSFEFFLLSALDRVPTFDELEENETPPDVHVFFP